LTQQPTVELAICALGGRIRIRGFDAAKSSLSPHLLMTVLSELRPYGNVNLLNQPLDDWLGFGIASLFGDTADAGGFSNIMALPEMPMQNLTLGSEHFSTSGHTVLAILLRFRPSGTLKLVNIDFSNVRVSDLATVPPLNVSDFLLEESAMSPELAAAFVHCVNPSNYIVLQLTESSEMPFPTVKLTGGARPKGIRLCGHVSVDIASRWIEMIRPSELCVIDLQVPNPRRPLDVGSFQQGLIVDELGITTQTGIPIPEISALIRRFNPRAMSLGGMMQNLLVGPVDEFAAPQLSRLDRLVLYCSDVNPSIVMQLASQLRRGGDLELRGRFDLRSETARSVYRALNNAPSMIRNFSAWFDPPNTDAAVAFIERLNPTGTITLDGDPQVAFRLPKTRRRQFDWPDWNGVLQRSYEYWAFLNSGPQFGPLLYDVVDYPKFVSVAPSSQVESRPVALPSPVQAAPAQDNLQTGCCTPLSFWTGSMVPFSFINRIWNRRP